MRHTRKGLLGDGSEIVKKNMFFKGFGARGQSKILK